MLNLRLYHGRRNFDEEIDETLNGGWGFDGPVLENILGMSWTYGIHLRIEFADAAAAAVARQLTGWEQWDSNVLCMLKWEDTILTSVTAPEGPPVLSYYGDFALYQPT